MSDLPLSLRRAAFADAYALWIWANDETTRRASHGRAPIPWRDHLQWLSAQLAATGAVILMAESEAGQPLGSVRFESADAWTTARLSYVVAPEARRQGLARPMVHAAAVWLRGHFPSVAMEAEVMLNNSRSLNVFRKLAWREIPQQDGRTRFRTP